MVERSFTNYVVVGLSPVAVIFTSDIAPVLSKEFLDIQATIECRFALKRVRHMIITYIHILKLIYFNEKLGCNLLVAFEPLLLFIFLNHYICENFLS